MYDEEQQKNFVDVSQTGPRRIASVESWTIRLV
jgi:hypothetical protein